MIIRQRRKELGLTAQELAAKTGLNTATIYRLERGEYFPQKATAKRLCAALGVKSLEQRLFYLPGLRALRLGAGLTQEQLADLADVTALSIRNLERLKHRTDSGLIGMIAETLGCDDKDLLEAD